MPYRARDSLPVIKISNGSSTFVLLSIDDFNSSGAGHGSPAAVFPRWLLSALMLPQSTQYTPGIPSYDRKGTRSRGCCPSSIAAPPPPVLPVHGVKTSPLQTHDNTEICVSFGPADSIHLI
ncbi:unnamed protein product [Danaus chrysippus]|uniref:(African queen) hypothetical protein n=1 Tax=Danaus chrysippus TaxID=151541 RepID=A0A8J2QVI3_9NEOP|nr:unnamed protein product [Danaus chrysippus]